MSLSDAFVQFRFWSDEAQLAKTKKDIAAARASNKPVVFILGTPTHRNIGDLAIAKAETAFLKSAIPDCMVARIPLQTVLANKDDILSQLVQPGDSICGIGGGNMGDMYLREEECRRIIMQKFPDNTIVIFPQTIHFSDTGRQEFVKTKAIYAAHRHLTLIAREQVSLGIMQEAFPNNTVLFTPDIVLSLNESAAKRPRDGLLICLRNDEEAKIGDAEKAMIADFSKQHFTAVRHTDTISDDPHFKYRSRDGVVDRKLDEFRSAKLVITDRLHGMVFSAITGTPCIAMASFNHKVTNTYKWLEHLPYVKFCADTAELEALAAQIDLDQTYDYDPAFFNEYWDKIKQAMSASV